VIHTSYLLHLARRCHDLEKAAIEPKVIEQLRIWATELAKMAQDSEPLTVQPEWREARFQDSPVRG
jgi:HPt (histidine-containing phosphotransfer) domain-containing protein